MSGCDTSNELLALLYQESNDKKNKELIYGIIYRRLEREACDVCHYYKNLLNKLANKDVFFEEAMQEARLCLIKCIEKFDTNKEAQLSTFYRTCLQNHISDFFKEFKEKGRKEIVDSTAFDWINDGYSDENIVENLDNQSLHNIFQIYIARIKFSKPIHENIFREYLGFIEDDNIIERKESFGTLGSKYNLSRMAVKKIVDKYLLLLVEDLTNNGEMEKLKEYL